MEAVLKVLYEDNESIILNWNKMYDNTNYILFGKDELFNDIKIQNVDTNTLVLNKKGISDKYVGVYIAYVTDIEDEYGESIIDKTNTISFSNKVLIVRTGKMIESYNSYSISMDVDKDYDMYYIYEKDNDNYNLVVESYNHIVTSNIFNKDKCYKIEAYNKEDDKYVLVAKSLDIKYSDDVLSKDRVDVSIIINLLSGDKSLSRCLDSIITSSKLCKDIILISNNSKENNDLIKWYKEKYKDLIKVIDSSDIPLYEGLELGIKEASGDYIHFMDSSDCIFYRSYENVVKCFERTGADIVTFKTIFKDNDGAKNEWFNVDSKEMYYTETCKDFVDGNKVSLFFNRLFNKVYRSSLIKKHNVPKLDLYVDVAYSLVLFSYANKIVLDNNAYYVYYDKNISFDNKNKGTLYVEALFYILSDCDKDNLDYLMYLGFDSLREYIKRFNESDNRRIKDDGYLNGTINVLNKYDYKNNELIANDIELINLLDSIKNID